jgi:hypothetical protein
MWSERLATSISASGLPKNIGRFIGRKGLNTLDPQMLLRTWS